MKKRKTVTIASISVGAVIAIACLFIFLMPIFGDAKSPDTQSTSENTIKAEETTVNNNTTNEQEALTEENGAEDIDEAGDVEEANDIEEDKNGDLEESDENLPGGGHEDAEGVEIDHQFEGIE